ncbi:MAG TPA: glycogen debranching enzyme GlgX, partial [Burkholderiaceae bacterium]|nr:glycogen debranching enzyme GlgX [Burkholderiaceae bacterium]
MSGSAAINTVWPGRPYPRGATWDGMGVNFALFSDHAERVELCLFEPGARHESTRLPLREQTDGVWHGYLPQARPGLLYGSHVYGPYRPRDGLRFNGNKLLIDPYARQIVGRLQWHDALFGYRVGHADGDLSFDRRDSSPYMPRCRVIEPAFSWGDDRAPG